MSKLKELWGRLGPEGVATSVSGVAAVVYAVYALISGEPISDAVLVGILGILLLEVVLQRFRLQTAKKDIIASLGGVSVEIFQAGDDFARAKLRELLRAEHSICDAELAQAAFAPSDKSSFRKLLEERVIKNRLTYRYVVVIVDRSRFEWLLDQLFRLHGHRYYIGYYPAPSELLPMLSLMVFDDTRFFLGGYYGPTARGQDRNMYVQHDQMAQTLREYFEYLWSNARLFNEYRTINWDEIRHCGLALGYTLDELNKAIKRIAENAGFSAFEVLQ